MANATSQAAAQPIRRPGLARYVQWIAVATALALSATQLAPLFHGRSKSQTADDLDAIIEQARKGVEDARLAQGKLPDVLPNAAVAGLVAYTPLGDSYQLFTSSGGVSVTLEMDGRKTVRQGKPP